MSEKHSSDDLQSDQFKQILKYVNDSRNIIKAFDADSVSFEMLKPLTASHRFIINAYRRKYKQLIIKMYECCFNSESDSQVQVVLYGLFQRRISLEKKMKRFYHEYSNVLNILDRFIPKTPDRIILPSNGEKVRMNLDEIKNIKNRILVKKAKADVLMYFLELETNEAEFAKRVTSIKYDYIYVFRLAKNFLVPTHPILIAIALNYSIFLYNFANDTAKAIKFSMNFLHKALLSLDTMHIVTHSQSIRLMELIRENLHLWCSEGYSRDSKAPDKLTLWDYLC